MKKLILSIALCSLFVSPSLFAAGKPGKEMQRKLNIIIPKVRLKNVTVEQALAFIRRLSRDMDPEGKGINIIYIKDSKKNFIK